MLMMLERPYNRDELIGHLKKRHSHLFHQFRNRYDVLDDTVVLEQAHQDDHGHEFLTPDHTHDWS